MRANDPEFNAVRALTRRHFFGQCGTSIGSMALASMLPDDLLASELPAAKSERDAGTESTTGPHFAPKARSVIYLHMAGSPPQQELFDHKPALIEYND